jgi:hypothetical protein
MEDKEWSIGEGRSSAKEAGSIWQEINIVLVESLLVSKCVMLKFWTLSQENLNVNIDFLGSDYEKF